METIEFGELYERYARDVLRFAWYLTGSRQEAEDITSETFVRAWTDSETLRVDTIKAYLFAIARNLHVDWRRRETRRGELAKEPEDPSPGPEGESGGKSELRAVIKALQQLPEVDRAALLMRTEEELSYEAIAAALGLSVVAVRVKVHRARMKLASLCGKEDPC
jgi:RNA polymerase sigma-70 factor (ECF subfamily)